MIRPWHTWVIFTLCLAVVLAAMGWMSLTVLRLERFTWRQATLEENVRLALWRMDSALAPLIAQESARPYFTYNAFYPAQRAYTRMFEEIQLGEVLIPSPLLDQASPYILLHFQVGPDGTFTSPQVPTGNVRDLAEARRYTTHERIETSAARLAELQSLLSRNSLLTALGPPETQPTQMAVLPTQGQEQASQRPSPQPQSRQPAQTLDLQQRARRQAQQIEIQQDKHMQQGVAQQTWLSANERQARVANVDTNTLIITNDGSNVLRTSFNVNEELARPMWIGEMLLLARWVSVNGGGYVQGCWFDWPAIRQWLTSEVKDLLPEARLKPVRSKRTTDEPRMLAALPLQLVPGPAPGYPGRATSPIQISLMVAWICALLAAVAVAALLVGTVSLSERRAAFVSAVTHEMRTPLTTFRMYTEMLTRDMIPDEAKRRRYLDTLRAEADRLSHLVGNVLAYARLERNRSGSRAETVTLRDLIDRLKERLTERAERAGMDLVVQAAESGLTTRVRADTSAVEQILFNLVDNACKYAASASDRRIHLEVDRTGKQVTLGVRDHGPGISRADARRLFRPFCKSARDAANSAPGVGLGLALSRRLARDMGGRLYLNQGVNDGACFVLSLPAGN